MAQTIAYGSRALEQDFFTYLNPTQINGTMVVPGRALRPKKAVASDWGGEGYEGGYTEPGSSQPQHRGRPVGQVAPQRVSETVPVSRPGQQSSPATRGGRGRGIPRGGFSR